MVIGRADLPAGATVELVPEGDTVAGQPTLDECGYRFTSEAEREERRQVDITYPHDPGRYSHEVVAYGGVADAAQAMDEWRTAVRRCPPRRFVKPSAPGVPPLRTRLLELHAMSALPVSNNAVARQLVTTRQGGSAYLAVIYQQHGRLLSGSYLTTADPPTQEQVGRLTSLAVTAGERLVQLPGGQPA